MKTLFKFAVVGGFVAITSSVGHGQTKPAGAGDWPTYGGNLASQRYAALDQISGANFNDLTVAWRIKTVVAVAQR